MLMTQKPYSENCNAPHISVDNSPHDEERWKSLLLRKSDVSQKWYYGVVTTGIFCKPGCASKLPNRENVRFFDSRSVATQAGFRACKRCKPDLNVDANANLLISACHYIENAVQSGIGELNLKSIAAQVNLSPWHFHRLFKQMSGITPKQYVNEVRAQLFRQQASPKTVQRVKVKAPANSANKNRKVVKNTVTEAIYRSGFESSSHFYSNTAKKLGMSPVEMLTGAQHKCIRYALCPSWLGLVLIAATEKGICSISIGQNKNDLIANLRTQFLHAELEIAEAGSPFQQWIDRAITKINTPSSDVSLPLEISGTIFQQKVWQALQSIPSGETRSYSDVARSIGQPNAARAVAQACAANKIAIAIPCHRVVRNDGALGGYRWTVNTKQKILEAESSKSKRS